MCSENVSSKSQCLLFCKTIELIELRNLPYNRMVPSVSPRGFLATHWNGCQKWTIFVYVTLRYIQYCPLVTKMNNVTYLIHSVICHWYTEYCKLHMCFIRWNTDTGLFPENDVHDIQLVDLALDLKDKLKEDEQYLISIKMNNNLCPMWFYISILKLMKVTDFSSRLN